MTSETVPQLRCSKCRAAPSPFLPAVVGGTHWKMVEHGVGIPGRKTTRNARACGTWIEQEPAGGPEQHRGVAALRPASSTERCAGFEPHPLSIYAEEYCVAPVYGDDGRPHYCGRPRSEHQPESRRG